MVDCFVYDGSGPYAPFHKEGHKGDPKVTPGTCGAIGERAQVILMRVRAPGIGNASHPQRLGITRVWASTMYSLWRANFRMLKNTSIGVHRYLRET